jgi:hypothetical protein
MTNSPNTTPESYGASPQSQVGLDPTFKQPPTWRHAAQTCINLVHAPTALPTGTSYGCLLGVGVDNQRQHTGKVRHRKVLTLGEPCEALLKMHPELRASQSKETQ